MKRFSDVKFSKFERLKNGDLSVENAVIVWPNFAGNPTDFNPAGGKRTFVLLLTPEVADDLKSEGWNIKCKPPKEDGDEPLYITEIVVNMESQFPPKVCLVTEYRSERSMTNLDEDTIAELDKIDYENVDVIIHPYEHGRSSVSTIKGYARSIYITQAQNNDFGGKYADYGSRDNDAPFR